MGPGSGDGAGDGRHRGRALSSGSGVTAAVASAPLPPGLLRRPRPQERAGADTWRGQKAAQLEVGDDDEDGGGGGGDAWSSRLPAGREDGSWWVSPPTPEAGEEGDGGGGWWSAPRVGAGGSTSGGGSGGGGWWSEPRVGPPGVSSSGGGGGAGDGRRWSGASAGLGGAQAAISSSSPNPLLPPPPRSSSSAAAAAATTASAGAFFPTAVDSSADPRGRRRGVSVGGRATAAVVPGVPPSAGRKVEAGSPFLLLESPFFCRENGTEELRSVLGNQELRAGLKQVSEPSHGRMEGGATSSYLSSGPGS